MLRVAAGGGLELRDQGVRPLASQELRRLSCVKCGDPELGWNPSGKGSAVCTRCSSPGDLPPPPERTWRHVAYRVDLSPFRDAIESETRNRAAGQMSKKKRTQAPSDVAPTIDRTMEAGVRVEVAAELLLGADRHPTRKGPDLTVAGGHKFEVKGSIAFKKLTMTVTKGYEPTTPIIYGLSDGREFANTYILGWIHHADWDRIKYESSRRQDDGRLRTWWTCQYKLATPWRRIEELMQEYLYKPYLPIGDPNRRFKGDPGIEEILDWRWSRAETPTAGHVGEEDCE